jgi:hypothetical protein
MASGPSPVEHGLDVWMEGVVDGAAAGGAFEDFPFRVGGGDRHLQIELDFGDSSWGILGHVFSDFDAHALKGDFFSFCNDAHHSSHAGAECGGDKIGGGECLAASIVIDGCIGADGIARGLVGGSAAQAALVGDLNANHDRDFLQRRLSGVLLRMNAIFCEKEKI